MKEDRQFLVLTHLSQLLGMVTGFGGFLVPLILWMTNKDKIYELDRQGKEIINFQITLFIFALICIPMILLLGLGIIGLIIIGLVGLIFPIINGIKVSNGEEPNYPFSIQFIK